MKCNLAALLTCLILSTSTTDAFVFRSTTTTTTINNTSSSKSAFQLNAVKVTNNNNQNVVQKAMLGTIAATSFMWSSVMSPIDNGNNNFQITAIPSAHAIEKASGSGSRVNKDPESLLRYGLPVSNKEVRQLQSNLENIVYDIGSKRTSAAIEGVKKSKGVIKKSSASMIKACTDPAACTTILSQMDTDLSPLEASLNSAKDFQFGSEQERQALDEAYKAQKVVAKELTTLIEQMVPPGYETPVPSDYDDLPQLKGRATVEFVLKKEDNQPFDINGENFKEAKLTMVIDGYTAPITGGNFVELVDKGFYSNMKIQRSDGFVVQTGDPDGEADGYTGGKPSKAIGAGKHGERLIPTEIFVKGDKGPFYESTVEDEGRGGEASVLPFSSYGAMGWAREEYDVNSGSSQFFWLLFDSDLTPAGKNVLDGRYPCFGYVVEGSDFLQDIKEGDTIVSAKVTKGIEKLVLPKEQ